MKNSKNKYNLIIGVSKDFNLENLLIKGNFDVSVNGSVEKAYHNLYNYSKSKNANIAVIEKKEASSIKGTLYLTKGNPFCEDNLIKGRQHFDHTSNKYFLLTTF